MNPFTTKSDPLINAAATILESKELNINAVLAYAKKIGGDVKGTTIDFGGGSVIKVSVAGDKIKFDGGKSSGIETFKSTADAIAALSQGIDEVTDLQERKINGVTAKTASEADRKKGESYSVYDKKTKKIVVGGITRASAKEIVDSDPDTYASGSSEWVADHLKEDLDEAVYGTNTPARKIAQAKSDIKEYKRNLKNAIADKKDPDTIKHWQKRIDASTKELADLMKNESVELEEGITHSRGFQQVAEKLDDIRGILSPNGILSKSISKQLGVGYIKDFKKISEMLADVEDAWDEIRKDLAMDEDRIND